MYVDFWADGVIEQVRLVVTVYSCISEMLSSNEVVIVFLSVSKQMP
jgi:hypothetical protein